jgi:hypothetical protein
MTDLSRPPEGHYPKVPCARCGTKRPENQMIGLQGKPYCSPECFEQALEAGKRHIDAVREAWLSEGTE